MHFSTLVNYLLFCCLAQDSAVFTLPSTEGSKTLYSYLTSVSLFSLLQRRPSCRVLLYSPSIIHSKSAFRPLHSLSLHIDYIPSSLALLISFLQSLMLTPLSAVSCLLTSYEAQPAQRLRFMSIDESSMPAAQSSVLTAF